MAVDLNGGIMVSHSDCSHNNQVLRIPPKLGATSKTVVVNKPAKNEQHKDAFNEHRGLQFEILFHQIFN
jgi:hypothetical protein